MSPISGQFHAYSTKCTAERIAGGDLFALLSLRGDVQEQAHPASAMVDDHDRIIAPEGA